MDAKDGLYDTFLKHILPKGLLLDAGCGSGRDSLYFINKGYKVIAFDASDEMVGRSSRLLGIEVKKMTFQDAYFTEKFDGIWACASLLHVNKIEIVDIIRNLSKCLKHNGFFYMSFKYGNKEYHKGERYFNCYDENSFENMIGNISELSIVKLFTTTDVRANKEGEAWLNCILKLN